MKLYYEKEYFLTEGNEIAEIEKYEETLNSPYENQYQDYHILLVQLLDLFWFHILYPDILKSFLWFPFQLYYYNGIDISDALSFRELHSTICQNSYAVVCMSNANMEDFFGVDSIDKITPLYFVMQPFLRPMSFFLLMMEEGEVQYQAFPDWLQKYAVSLLG